MRRLAQLLLNWYVYRYQPAITFTQVRGGIHLHTRTCAPLFRISGTAGPIMLKFCIWHGTPQMRALFKTELRWGVHLQVRTCRFLLHEDGKNKLLFIFSPHTKKTS